MVVVDAIIEALTDQVFTGLMNQAQFALDFKSQFDAMKTQLDIMKAFLADTENLKIKKATLKTTLIKLRELLYEADDLLTDCMIRDEYQKYGSCSTFSASQWFFKYQMGKKLKDINSRMEKMEKYLSTYLTPQQLLVLGENTCRPRVFTFQDFDSSEIVGLENDSEKLKEWIFSQCGLLQRIGIVGMGGLGKTTIAQKVFNDKMVAGRFEQKIWVSVSQDFSEERIFRSILEQLGKHVPESDPGQMLHKINESLQGKNCLIVLDDVWNFNIDCWGKLFSAVPKHTNKRSCVIITTRDEEVAARLGVENSGIHRPKLLNDYDSWSLFCKFAFSTSKGMCPSQTFEQTGKKILGKCGGLPLAIKTIAALLASEAHNLAKWNEIHEQFHELTTRGTISSVTASLQLSYDALPTHLRQLLLCFSIYPEDFVIGAEQLVHWWVGEGFIRATNSKTAMELGYEYVMELARRCLVEVVEQRGYDGRVYSCKMHDLVRELSIMIVEDEMFSSSRIGKLEITPESRWLGFTSEMITASLKHCSKLRALLLMSSDQCQVPFNKNSLGFLSSLRVLDLSQIKLDENFDIENLLNWIVSLERLAHLNLSGATGLEEVPSSIRKLRNLQLLILSGCSNLVKLHRSITYLKKLVVLDLGSCPIQYLPQGIKMLSHLQELSGFRVVSQASQSCRLLELGELLQLRVLRMNLSSESEIPQDDWKVLKNLKKLKVLAINTEDCKDTKIIEMLNQLCPPPSLQELYLRRYRHQTLPTWINAIELSSLQYLCIENGDLSYISRSSQSEEGSGSTWNLLEGLCLKYLPYLEEDWSAIQQNMPSLRYVEVSHCLNLKNFPCPSNEAGIWRKIES